MGRKPLKSFKPGNVMRVPVYSHVNAKRVKARGCGCCFDINESLVPDAPKAAVEHFFTLLQSVP
jgi:hypothetical protein